MPTNSKGDNISKSISMPPALLLEVEARMKALGIDNFSRYARKLIEDDLSTRGALIYQENTESLVNTPHPTPRRPRDFATAGNVLRLSEILQNRQPSST